MSQLVTQTTSYGLNSVQYSISTLSDVGGVLEIMAGSPHDETTAPAPIADFKSDQSAKFYGTVTAPSLSITADNAKVKDKNIVRSVNGTVTGADGNVTITVPSGYVHPNSGVTAGTYNNVTVNAQGHVTAGSNVSVVKTVNNTSPDSNGNVTITTDLSNYAKLNVANKYNGEQVFVNKEYCPTMLDIATGIGCAFKGTRACFDQGIIGQVILPSTSATDNTFCRVTSGQIKVQYISVASASDPALVTIGYFDSNGWNGRATKDGQGNDIASSYVKKSEISYGTEDLTAGSSPLEKGKLYFVYE